MMAKSTDNNPRFDNPPFNVPIGTRRLDFAQLSGNQPTEHEVYFAFGRISGKVDMETAIRCIREMKIDVAIPFDCIVELAQEAAVKAMRAGDTVNALAYLQIQVALDNRQPDAKLCHRRASDRVTCSWS